MASEKLPPTKRSCDRSTFKTESLDLDREKKKKQKQTKKPHIVHYRCVSQVDVFSLRVRTVLSLLIYISKLCCNDVSETIPHPNLMSGRFSLKSSTSHQPSFSWNIFSYLRWFCLAEIALPWLLWPSVMSRFIPPHRLLVPSLPFFCWTPSRIKWRRPGPSPHGGLDQMGRQQTGGDVAVLQGILWQASVGHLGHLLGSFFAVLKDICVYIYTDCKCRLLTYVYSIVVKRGPELIRERWIEM